MWRQRWADHQTSPSPTRRRNAPHASADCRNVLRMHIEASNFLLSGRRKADVSHGWPDAPSASPFWPLSNGRKSNSQAWIVAAVTRHIIGSTIAPSRARSYAQRSPVLHTTNPHDALLAPILPIFTWCCPSTLWLVVCWGQTSTLHAPRAAAQDECTGLCLEEANLSERIDSYVKTVQRLYLPLASPGGDRCRHEACLASRLRLLARLAGWRAAPVRI